MNELITKDEIQKEGPDWEYFKQNFLRSQQGLSCKTVSTYKTGINCFTRWLGQEDIERPVPDDIYDFQSFLQKSEYSVFTTNVYMISLKKFFEYLEKPYEGKDFKAYSDIYKMASPQIRRPERRKHHREMPTEIEVSKLRGILQGEDQKSRRDLLMIDLGLYCGLRVNEISNLRIEDIRAEDDDKCRLYVLRKGHADRNNYVYLDTGIADRLLKYAKKYKLKRFIFTDTVHNNKTEKLQSSTISLTISKNLQKAGIKRRTLTAHSLRHYAGTKYYQETKDLYACQAFLGHKDSQTTQIYMHTENNYTQAGIALAPA